MDFCTLIPISAVQTLFEGQGYGSTDPACSPGTIEGEYPTTRDWSLGRSGDGGLTVSVYPRYSDARGDTCVFPPGYTPDFADEPAVTLSVGTYPAIYTGTLIVCVDDVAVYIDATPREAQPTQAEKTFGLQVAPVLASAVSKAVAGS